MDLNSKSKKLYKISQIRKIAEIADCDLGLF